MKKIPTLFVRDPQNPKLVTREMNINLNGLKLRATIKHDGTCCAVRDGRLYARKAVKGVRGWFTHDWQVVDPEGWVEVDDSPEYKWHREAWTTVLPDGTYELIGPKVQGNPYELSKHELIAHGSEPVTGGLSLDFDEIRTWCERHLDHEGVVWWFNGEPVCKIKRRDFGLPWGR